jgi:S-adenosylmethionine hydrolase
LPIITLLTDFGLADPYVGMMKGVIAGICPEANVVDLTHAVPPQDVRTGAFFLERAFRFFPKGTVHLAVVDPGVGTSRRALAASAGGHLFVGPDNGVLSLAARRRRAVSITQRSYFLSRVSNTFHGRDVFAPVAAHLARGVPLDRFGPSQSRVVELSWPKPRRTKRARVGEIISVDRFGNLISNFEPSHWASLKRPCLFAGALRCAKLSRSYQDVERGALAVVVGGYGLLEIAARDDSAANTLGLTIGDRVELCDGA